MAKTIKKRSYLNLYKKWCKTGELPYAGLCCNLYPRQYEKFRNLYITNRMSGYWGYDGRNLLPLFDIKISKEKADEIRYKFTPLRQNLILFLAAMNNEL